jgi:hypothetical protein
MTILQSEIAVGSEQYQQNREALLNQIAEVRAVQQKVLINLMRLNQSLIRKAKFCRTNVCAYYWMRIHLLSSYVV